MRVAVLTVNANTARFTQRATACVEVTASGSFPNASAPSDAFSMTHAAPHRSPMMPSAACMIDCHQHGYGMEGLASFLSFGDRLCAVPFLFKLQLVLVTLLLCNRELHRLESIPSLHLQSLFLEKPRSLPHCFCGRSSSCAAALRPHRHTNMATHFAVLCTCAYPRRTWSR
ncbi:hypothetical protein ABBQ32_007081 [Trebouxia sp. C0010 RCD-2024]